MRILCFKKGSLWSKAVGPGMGTPQEPDIEAAGNGIRL